MQGFAIGGNNFFKSMSGSGTKMRTQVFTANGTFTPPAGVTEVFITACGAGGGGGYGWNNSGNIGYQGGGTGGVTSFGALLSLSGGGAGNAGNTSVNGVGAGMGQDATRIGMWNGSSFAYNTKGGDSLFLGNWNKSKGGKGAGGSTDAGQYNSAGGGGDFVVNQQVSVVPLTPYTITIGAGGTAASSSCQKGGDGYMQVTWFEPTA